MIKKPLIFVCSPLRGEDVRQNQIRAAKYSRFVAKCGGVPITPHIYFTQFYRDNIPEERNAGINLGLEALANCSQIWVFGRALTVGMRIEIRRAKDLKIPVHFFDENGNALPDSELDWLMAHDYSTSLRENSEDS